MKKIIDRIGNSKVWNILFAAFCIFSSILVLFTEFRPHYLIVAMLFLLASIEPLVRLSK